MHPDVLDVGAVLAAATIALAHTALGPDHYLPFIVLARARHWSRARTLAITAACGLGHLLSSLALGGLGLAAGAALGELEALELARGGPAGWALCAFGGAYLLWGLRRGLRERRGLELHAHGGHGHAQHGHEEHVHLHAGGGHRHVHAPPDATGRGFTVFWALFLIFVLGPCEPLIPLFLVPASQGRWALAVVMAVVFGVVTLAAMLGLTALALRGVERLPLARVERWMHALSGAVVLLSGVAVLLGA